jgi:hypothetical protein
LHEHCSAWHRIRPRGHRNHDGLHRGLLPRNALAAGAIYGAGVWAAMYPLALPLAGLYPKPDDDKEARAWTIGLAHLVYGITLAAAYDAADYSAGRRDR